MHDETMGLFDRVLQRTLNLEGGVSDRPEHEDRGGLTNHGITQDTFDAYSRRFGLPKKSVRDLNPNEVRDVYYKMFWTGRGYDQIVSEEVAARVFDAAVHSGPVEAVKQLQRACNVLRYSNMQLLAVDGVCGRLTLHAVDTFLDRGAEKALVNCLVGERYLSFVKIGDRDPDYLAQNARGWFGKRLW